MSCLLRWCSIMQTLFNSYYLCILVRLSFQVSARSCDGGHRCSPPKECCVQGCCFLYAPPSAPRTTPPTSDHMLNLVFINHWYFWLVEMHIYWRKFANRFIILVGARFLVVAVVMAVLCACSLWRKRRQLCGWGSPRPHSQSGDSAGSCYAPPQYSRCSSFHHAPPPYTEVDLIYIHICLKRMPVKVNGGNIYVLGRGEAKKAHRL